MARETKEQKLINKRVETAYYQSCSGIQIPMMSIPKVFEAGRVAVAEGADDETLKAKIRAFVETIRVN